MPVRVAFARTNRGTIAINQPASVWGRVTVGFGLFIILIATLSLLTGQSLPGLQPLSAFLWFAPMGGLLTVTGLLALGNRNEFHFGPPAAGVQIVVKKWWLPIARSRLAYDHLRRVRVDSPPRDTIAGFTVSLERTDGRVINVDGRMTVEEAWDLAARVSEAAWNLEVGEGR